MMTGRTRKPEAATEECWEVNGPCFVIAVEIHLSLSWSFGSLWPFRIAAGLCVLYSTVEVWTK